MSIIYTILIFGVIILIHELGHFLVARLSGITIQEFSIGMGPAIFKRKGKQTLYSIRLLPIGGYVAMAGEDEASDDENAFCNKPIWKRMLVILAGAFMNLILGFGIMFGIYAMEPAYNTTTVAQFLENATTQESGLQVGDKIVKMNKSTILTDQDIIFEIVRDDDGLIDMQVIRDGKKVMLSQVNFDVTGEGAERQFTIDFKVLGQKRTIFSTTEYTFKKTISLAKNAWASVGDLITGKIGFNELSGPVGVGQAVEEAKNYGVQNVLMLAAFITISIGMFNLLPFPALDGGRFVFLVIEAIIRRPINRKVEAYVNGVGLLLLFGLMIVITLKDIIHLF